MLQSSIYNKDSHSTNIKSGDSSKTKTFPIKCKYIEDKRQ